MVVHERGHHVEGHSHLDSLEIMLHGHDHEEPADHVHELTAPFSASRVPSSDLNHAAYSAAIESGGGDYRHVGSLHDKHGEARDLGPPVYLVHCVSLT